MRLPQMTELSTSRSITEVFGGYNHNLRIGDGEFYDMKNLTSAYYPILSPRGQRGTYNNATNPLGLIAKDNLCYVDGATLYINGTAVNGLVLATNTEKTLVSMGAYIIILPDKKWVNTANTTEYGSIEASVTTSANVTFSLCKVDGSAFSASSITNSATAPSEPTDKQYWIDTSSTPHTLKQYSATSEMWVSVATTYIKIESSGIGSGFSQYDGVKISGIQTENNTQLNELNNGNFVLWEVGTNYIVIVGMLDATATISNHITVSRQMPTMDFVIESENRLWGCHYGIVDGKAVNEIYASKQGDFKNWNCFMGLSTDSYVASVGTDGVFTGAFTYLGYPMFFKEGFVHKVYGSYPAQYQIQTTACRGVQRGSSKSLDMVNEVLYYKGKNGICAYDGSLPAEISSVLGEVNYSNAVACSHGNKYYISMKDDSNVYHLFVYDVQKGLWHKEDNTQVNTFCSCRNELYYIEVTTSGNTTTKKIKTMFGSGTKDTGKIKWMAETGIISADYPDKKYISRMLVRMSLELGATVSFFIQYDSMGEWEHICTHTSSSLRSFSMPIAPRRCDHFRIRIEGVGDAKIYSITKTIEQGSDT